MPRQNQIQFRKGTSSQWTDNNPVLASGEPGYESDSNRLKIGVGLNWDDTSYISADSLITTVYNKTNSTISGFSVVYISGGQGNLPAISPSIATTDSTSANTYGITVSNIPTNSSGLVITNGLLKNVNTNKFGTNKEGSSLWLSPTVSGDLTLAKPYAPYHAVFVGTIVRSHNTQGVVEVKIQNGYELEELHDVAVTGVVNGQFLQYNTASGLWIPSSSGNFSTLSVNNNPVYHSGILPNPVIGVGISGYLSKWINNSGVSSGIIFDNGTNIGIGTATPSRNLHVIGTGLFDSLNIGGTPLGGISIPFFTRSTTNSASSSILFIENTSYDSILDVRGDGNVAIGNVGGPGFSHRLVVKGSTSNSSVAALSVINSGNTSILFARNDGNVGIGTASPGYKLQVNGSFAASTKSFRIHHPSKKGYSLEYGSLESPYHGVRLTGRDKVIKGHGTVKLPDYLKDLIHNDESITIQLTNYKHGKTLYVDKIDLQNDRFVVKADRAKTLGELEFFWTLTGVRKDVEDLVVEKRN